MNSAYSLPSLSHRDKRYCCERLVGIEGCWEKGKGSKNGEKLNEERGQRKDGTTIKTLACAMIG